MTTVSSRATLLDLQAGAAPLAPNSAEVMSITMKTRKVSPAGTVLNTGNTYSVPKAFGQLCVEMAWATDTNAILPNRIGRTVDELRTSVNTFTYDGSLRLTNFTADGIAYFISYPNSTTINIYFGDQGRQITLNASQQVTSIASL